MISSFDENGKNQKCTFEVHITFQSRKEICRFSITVSYYTFISKLNFDHKMVPFIIKTFLLFLGSVNCRFPNAWSQNGKDNNWALTQVLIYYAEEFHQSLIPGFFVAIFSSNSLILRFSKSLF